MAHENSEISTGASLHGEAQGAPTQGHVNAHFDSTAPYWDGVYRGSTLQGLIYQERQSAVLAYLDGAGVSPGSRVLEIGCGAGHLTVELARRGFQVEAIDASRAMIESAARLAQEEGVKEKVKLGVADVHALPYGEEDFQLVVAVGVIPWLHSPALAVGEMYRVLARGGTLILTADNRARLISFTDPRGLLALSPLRSALVALRRRRGQASSRLDYPWSIDRLLSSSGLRPLSGRTIGFGPLSLMGRPLIGEERAISVNNRLQMLADRGVPGLRRTGWHYVVHAVKP